MRRRLSEPRGIERAGDLHAVDPGVPLVDRIYIVYASGPPDLKERRGQHVTSRANVHAEVTQVLVFHPPTVEGDVDRETGVGQRRVIAADTEAIVSVERKVILHAQPAERSEREPLQVLVLRELLRRLVDRRALRSGHVAHRGPAQLHRCGGIPLDERRRNSETRGDIVETRAGVVGRQQAAHICRHAEQVTDCVGVLGAIQPVQRRCRRRRAAAAKSRLRIQARFQHRSDRLGVCA
jgi:hypothetical protein